jgi:acetyl-CoA acetyltransferase
VTDVRVKGVGMHPFGRFTGVTGTDMGVAAVRAALDEAALDVRQVQAAFCGTAYGGVASGHRVLGAIAGTGIPIVDVEAGCASGGAALQLGAASIASGQYERVLVFGLEKMPKGVIRSSFFAPWQEAGGLTPAPAYFALRAQRLLADTGLTREHLAQVVVKNRSNGTANPDAMFRKGVTVEEVLAARMICDPLTLFMLCSPNEGAAAIVLEEGGAGVKIAGISLRSHLPGNVLGEDSPLCGVEDSQVIPPTQLAADDAYRLAGVGPLDIDVTECQDTDPARELLAWAELGLCETGDQARLLEEESTLIGGRIPINPSGGLLSKGEPLGASALGQVVEIVRQLRGTAGVRQVDGARTGLCHVIGRGANACVTILSR